MKIDKSKFTYWQLRDLQNEQQNQDEATKRLKIINSAYQKAQSYLSDEVQKIYRRYFYADISEQEVSDIMASHISPSELVTLKALASNITDKESKIAIDDYLSRLAAKSRITRLEELRVKAYIAAKSAGDVELDQNIKLHTNVMQRTWGEVEKQGAVYDKAKDYKLPDTKIKPSVESKGNEVIIKNPETSKKVASVKMEQDIPKDKITEIPNHYVEAALNTRWEGKNFSSRIWDNTDKLAERLQELFTTKELSNMSERDMIKQIAHEFNTSKFNASRLIRTEANFFYSKIKLDDWRKRGVERYQLLAVIDSRTSKICRSINGKVFKVRDAIFGKNMPPLHPFCRTVPVIYLGPKNNTVVSKKNNADEYVKFKKILGDKAPSRDLFNNLKRENDIYWQNLNIDLNRRLYLKEHPEEKLPNLNNMLIPTPKFTKYLFNTENERGWSKGKLIKEKLGYDKSNYMAYVDAIKEAAKSYPVKFKGNNGFGNVYEQKIMLYNSDGKPINVIVGWIVMDNNPDQIKYTSSYIKEVKKNE